MGLVKDASSAETLSRIRILSVLLGTNGQCLPPHAHHQLITDTSKERRKKRAAAKGEEWSI